MIEANLAGRRGAKKGTPPAALLVPRSAWGVLEGARMHAMFFGTKRAFHATLRILRKPMKSCGLTPARFDLLYVISRTFFKEESQRTLRKTLGVTAPTVSRMVKSLEALGLVHNKRHPSDGRQRIVELTEAGLRCIQDAIECFIRGRIGKRILQRAFRPIRAKGMSWRDAVFANTCGYEDLLGSIRYRCGDTATLHYPWHPDD